MIKRNTIQCALVHETVSRLACHATADETYDALTLEYPSISRGTVYRNLQRLCESGEIRRCEIPGGADRYDHRRDAHYHVKCERCGRVFDVEMTYMANLETAVRNAHGFLLTGHDLVFRGICPDCRNCDRPANDAETNARNNPAGADGATQK